MENTEKRKLDDMDSLNDTAVENVAGGTRIDHVVCCTCGREVHLNGPMMGQYYNNNICPYCKGRLKSW